MDCPLVNMWCPHTSEPMMAIERLEKAMPLYPKMGRCAWTATISLITPNAGRIMMYTAGCE